VVGPALGGGDEVAEFVAGSLAGTLSTTQASNLPDLEKDVMKGFIASCAGVALGPVGEIAACTAMYHM
jgi:hypothetical protein